MQSIVGQSIKYLKASFVTNFTTLDQITPNKSRSSVIEKLEILAFLNISKVLSAGYRLVPSLELTIKLNGRLHVHL